MYILFQNYLKENITTSSALGSEIVDAVITTYMNQEEVRYMVWEICGQFPNKCIKQTKFAKRFVRIEKSGKIKGRYYEFIVKIILELE